MTQVDFWKIRSQKYNNLKWVNDNIYLNKIIAVCKPQKTDLVLDVGTGSGKVAKAIKPYVKHVIGMDISTDMMSYNNWEGMSKICNDILTPIFKNETFNIITARMVFHHVEDVLLGLVNCYHLLKPNGRIVIAESIPPSDNIEVVKWWSYIRELKEKRHTFIEEDLKSELLVAKFSKISFKYYYSPKKESSVKKWLEYSKLPKNTQQEIFELIKNAPEIVKKAHKMEITNNDIFCVHRHLIISGVK